MYFKDHLNVKRQNFDYFEGLELVFENSRVFKKHINPVLYVKIYLLCTRNVAQCMPHFVNVQDSIFLYFTINIKTLNIALAIHLFLQVFCPIWMAKPYTQKN